MSCDIRHDGTRHRRHGVSPELRFMPSWEGPMGGDGPMVPIGGYSPRTKWKWHMLGFEMGYHIQHAGFEYNNLRITRYILGILNILKWERPTKMLIIGTPNFERHSSLVVSPHADRDGNNLSKARKWKPGSKFTGQELLDTLRVS